MAESVPPQDVDRVAAARRAVERRRARASIKRDLAMRVVSGQEVLRRAAEDPTSAAGTLRVPDFLTALPAIGLVVAGIAMIYYPLRGRMHETSYRRAGDRERQSLRGAALRLQAG